jgi:hypothetical protein
MERDPMPEHIETLKCDATPEQRRELEAAWAEYVKSPPQLVPVPEGSNVTTWECYKDYVGARDDPVRQVDMLVANIPADSTGVLIVKIHGDCIRQDVIDRFGWSLRQVVSAAGLSVSLLLVVDTDEAAFDFQLLTNEQLRDIGFKRVEPVPDYLGITKDVV